ncbi:MAG: hypothetical protein KGQ93_11840 [Cyanobacteria bacterium REEB459]|nr:hypothetical protein [Cyanobacteria bacterium REEB459]
MADSFDSSLAANRPILSQRRGRHRSFTLFERLMAILALLNLVLVGFDLSYIPWRDLYLKMSPRLTTWYGETFKGIEPHRSTSHYLETVDRLQNQVAQTGLTSAAAQTILLDLQRQSAAMVAENPFALANKSGTLERIKMGLRDHMGLGSATDSFTQFWSYSHLSQAGFNREINFFSRKVRPLIATNYFRHIDLSGSFVNHFWRLDMAFNLLFGVELLARSVYLRRRYKNFRHRDALLWRWYDLLLVLPFSGLHLSWLALSRVIPVMIRLNQANLVDLNPIQSRINHLLLSQVAVEITEVVVLRIIDQVQSLLRDGTLAQTLLSSQPGRRYIDINGVNELEVIVQRLLSLTVLDVLPEVKPEIDAFLHHTVTQAFAYAPGYREFRQIPGLGTLPAQIAEQVVAQVSRNAYGLLKGSLDQPSGLPLAQALGEKFTDSLKLKLQEKGNIQELEGLLVSWLEEVKLNYVKGLARTDMDRLIEERYHIYSVTQAGSVTQSGKTTD